MSALVVASLATLHFLLWILLFGGGWRVLRDERWPIVLLAIVFVLFLVTWDRNDRGGEGVDPLDEHPAWRHP